MTTTGAFGFKLGKKIRLMQVDKNADILWQICVRELYILMKHYGTCEALSDAFKQLKDAKGNPTRTALEQCIYFQDHLYEAKEKEKDWGSLLKYCQLSYINVLESGYFLNNGTKTGLVFLLDLNTYSVRLYEIDKKSGKEKEHQCATLHELLEFDDMPTITLSALLDDMKGRYHVYQAKMADINSELAKVNTIIEKTKEMGSDQNIMTKTRQLLDTLLWDKKKVDMEYRFLYNRLKTIDLIEDEA